MILTHSQIDKYHSDGCLCVETFIDINQARQILTKLPDITKEKLKTNYKPSVFKIHNPHQTHQIAGRLWELDPIIGRLLLSSKIGQACAILGNWQAGTRAIHSSLWIKNPNALGVSYHQDAVFTQIFYPNDIIIAYIPLQNMIKEAGSVEYIKGSHRWELGKRVSFHQKDYTESLDILFETSLDKEQLEIISYDAPIGSCIFHHGLSLHGSNKNRTSEPRIGITLVTISAESIVNKHTKDMPSYVFEINEGQTISEEKYPIIWNPDGYISPRVFDIFVESNEEI